MILNPMLSVIDFTILIRGDPSSRSKK